MSALLGRARRLVSSHLGEVTLNLPFVSIALNPKDIERKVAREVIIRLRDRRVLSARECCDNCIKRSVASLQEIRRVLIDKQVELADARDGPLYLMMEMMAAGIRQFVTFEEGLCSKRSGRRHHEYDGPLSSETRDQYFAALELLRDHLNHCIQQVTAIAGMNESSESYLEAYKGPWRLSAYKDAL